MKRSFLSIIILSLILCHSAYARLPDIVALVNNQPITKYDLDARIQMLSVFHNADMSNPAVSRQLARNAINILVNESLIMQYAVQMKLPIHDAQIDDAIHNISASNNMQYSEMLSYLKNNDIDVDHFRDHMKSEVIRSDILRGLSHKISVSQNELDYSISNDLNKDFEIDAWIFTSIHSSAHDAKNTNNVMNQMRALRKNLVSCDHINDKLYSDFATAVEMHQKLRNFSTITRAIIADLKINSLSSIYQEESKFKLVFLCNKKLLVSDKDSQRVKIILSDHKMSKEAIKFFGDLKSKAYIKIMVPY